MKHIVNTHNELLEKVNELVKDGYRQTDVTEYEIVFTKVLHARDTIFPTFWHVNMEQKND